MEFHLWKVGPRDSLSRYSNRCRLSASCGFFLCAISLAFLQVIGLADWLQDVRVHGRGLPGLIDQEEMIV